MAATIAITASGLAILTATNDPAGQLLDRPSELAVLLGFRAGNRYRRDRGSLAANRLADLASIPLGRMRTIVVQRADMCNRFAL
jgi:hypothetical protein